MDRIKSEISNYYTNKFNEFGATPKGADWNSIESQYLRFDKLLSVIDNKTFSDILDFGCGYGELINYLKKNDFNFKYTGYDISEIMLNEARNNYSNNLNIKFINEINDLKADYVIASGIFNVKLNLVSDDIWLNYILETLVEINNISKKGFSFNVLTSYSDNEKMRSDLYYADPLFLFDFCKKNFSKEVALLHDYGLYEFTLRVKK